ncbi:DUF2201 family putative metallopeptidase [Hyphococcus sp.]|uniref:DUF2201 family putative metallopeptidase n=1 Tax=Hyphococcus sp. TaxID=2038636 RepID=UPI0035C775D1
MNAGADNLRLAQEHAQRALNNVRNFQPYLGDLADIVNIFVEPRLPTAGITADGRLFVNPDWFLSLSGPEAIYVIAHELWHLVLQSHARASPEDAWFVNIAHDWIINKILTDELGIVPPKNGLWFYDADNHSAEEMVRWLKDGSAPEVRQQSVWDAAAGAPQAPVTQSPFADALRGAGLAPDESESRDGEKGECPGDILTDEDLRRLSIDPSSGLQLSPPLEDAAADITARTGALKRAADIALNTHAAVTTALQARHPDINYPHSTALLDIIETSDKIPIELALQRGFDMMAPNLRTFSRASRRQGARRDIILPGRRNEGWTINLILDTSGSMAKALPRLLLLIKSSAIACGASHVRIVQASNGVTADEVVEIEALERFEISGYGGSDLTAAFDLLAGDTEVVRAVVLSDMAIQYPATPPPYEVFWLAVQAGAYAPSKPEYGILTVLKI